MSRQTVVSREYKIMLRNDLFQGDRPKVVRTANQLAAEFADSVARVALESEGKLADGDGARLVSFADTARHQLNGVGYIFRVRQDETSGEREVTLKFRHRDRHVAQDRDMGAASDRRGKTKFEEDIKKPFVSLYSFSTTVKVERDRTFRKMADIARVFPAITDAVDQVDADDAVAPVNDFVAREVVLKGTTLRLGRSPEVRAECALIVWYRPDRNPEQPVAVEYSYRYGDEDERYGGKMALRAFDVFDVMQDKLRDWIEPTDLTKTAIVYRKRHDD